MSQLYWPFDTSKVSEWPGGYSDIRYGVHMGTDFAVAQGTELAATQDGVISNVYQGTVDGWGIDIKNNDGRIVRNWHMSEIKVRKGQEVKTGDIIGLTGGAKGSPGAGNSTGPHLHWEIRTNSNFSQNGWLDPRNLDVKSLSEAPNENTSTKEDDMNIIRDTNGTYFLATATGMHGIQDPGRLELIQRMLKSNPENPETFAPGQIDFLAEYLTCGCK